MSIFFVEFKEKQFFYSCFDANKNNNNKNNNNKASLRTFEQSSWSKSFSKVLWAELAVKNDPKVGRTLYFLSYIAYKIVSIQELIQEIIQELKI